MKLKKYKFCNWNGRQCFTLGNLEFRMTRFEKEKKTKDLLIEDRTKKSSSMDEEEKLP